MHLEHAIAREIKCFFYCCKEDPNPFVYGRLNRESGNLNQNMDDITELIYEHPGNPYMLAYIQRSWPLTHARYSRSIEKTLADLPFKVKRNTRTRVFIIWGPPRTYKSSRCVEICKRLCLETFHKSGNSKFWGSYRGEAAVIMDDFYGYLAYDDLLRLFDRFPTEVDYKGGQRQFVSTHVFVTSNADPATWYPNRNTDALFSDRIDFIMHTATGIMTVYHRTSRAIMEIFRPTQLVNRMLQDPPFDGEGAQPAVEQPMVEIGDDFVDPSVL